MLVGLAFATPISRSRAAEEREGFGLLFRLGVIPLILFSGAFFPISNLGPVLEWLARLTPLWHGVELSRMFCARQRRLDAGAGARRLLVVLTVIGWWLAVRRLTKRLVV